MPLTKKGLTIKRSMARQYGKEKGERVFYASERAGTITGVKKGGSHKKKKPVVRRRRKPKMGGY